MNSRTWKWLFSIVICFALLFCMNGCDVFTPLSDVFDSLTSDGSESEGDDYPASLDYRGGGFDSFDPGGSDGGDIGNGDGQIQSGTLTAGSFDDNLNYEVFKTFISEMLQADSGGTLPDVSAAKRIVITVRNDADEPIGNVRVVVAQAGDQEQTPTAFLDTTTGSDGRVLFLPLMDGGAEIVSFTVSAYPPGDGEPVTLEGNPSESAWNVILPSAESVLPDQLDLAFVIDATGSMTDELEYLKKEVESLANSIKEQYPAVDQRYALIVYRDQGDDYVTRTFDFTDSLSTFQGNLSAQRADGGGDYEEAVHTALGKAGELTWRNGNAARVLFWIADAPPHTENFQQALDAVMALRKDGVAMYPVAASGVSDEAEFLMRASAFVTHSQYLFLTDDSGVGNEHAEPHIPCYWVETLKNAMMRMIAIELTGQAVEPDPEDIIRTVGNPPGPCTTQPAQ